MAITCHHPSSSEGRTHHPLPTECIDSEKCLTSIDHNCNWSGPKSFCSKYSALSMIPHCHCWRETMRKYQHSLFMWSHHSKVNRSHTEAYNSGLLHILSVRCDPTRSRGGSQKPYWHCWGRGRTAQEWAMVQRKPIRGRFYTFRTHSLLKQGVANVSHVLVKLTPYQRFTLMCPHLPGFIPPWSQHSSLVVLSKAAYNGYHR